MIERDSVRGMEDIKKDTSFDCISCVKGKAERLPFSGTRPRATEFIQNIHVDLSGIVRQGSLDDTLYYILFTDDFSGMKFVYKLKSKNKTEVHDVSIKFIAMVERQCDRQVKGFTLDQGSELFNSLFEPYCEERGILLHDSAAYTPE